MKTYKRIAYLSADAAMLHDFAQLAYRCRRLSGIACVPLAICPPIDQLKAGTKIIQSLQETSFITKIELANEYGSITA